MTRKTERFIAKMSNVRTVDLSEDQLPHRHENRSLVIAYGRIDDQQVVVVNELRGNGTQTRAVGMAFFLKVLREVAAKHQWLLYLEHHWGLTPEGLLGLIEEFQPT